VSADASKGPLRLLGVERLGARAHPNEERHHDALCIGYLRPALHDAESRSGASVIGTSTSRIASW
jgi:hypothetical protein